MVNGASAFDAPTPRAASGAAAVMSVDAVSVQAQHLRGSGDRPMRPRGARVNVIARRPPQGDPQFGSRPAQRAHNT